MIEIEVFRQWMDEILAELPAEFFEELNGGVLLLEEKKMHPRSIGNDLYVMGEYRRERVLGRYIVLYYGSYAAIYGGLSEQRLRQKIRGTILHEFRHHLEYRAGEKGLEIEDHVKINRYLNRKKHQPDSRPHIIERDS